MEITSATKIGPNSLGYRKPSPQMVPWQVIDLSVMGDEFHLVPT